ncbi:MAG: DUF1553 domain-containing protein [Bacteroidota bacterium]
MPVPVKRQIPLLLLFGSMLFSLLLVFANCQLAPSSTIDFNTQVKPILNKHCIHCHGGVKQSGGVSMMTRAHLLQPANSGKVPIIPYDSDGSEFIQRLTETDVEKRMPFEASPLSEREIATLTQWVEEGATWGVHWAYQPVEKVTTPKITEKALGAVNSTSPQEWGNNEIDHFIHQKLQVRQLTPSEAADKRAILRRVSLDLIGLPAPRKIADQFLNANDSEAYERLVDQLLALPAYGEKWASMWLDLARYADTKGFERDPNRDIYAYRDYVIKAFNQDLPYDQFITEQLAGDLLPNPTDEQYIATGFHRNTTTNDEGGTDNEEYRVAAVIDRVNTTGTAILGTTFACVQCHGHPYDPFEHEEYYQMLAFFNNTRDEDTHQDYPLLRRYRPKDSLKLAKVVDWVQKTESPERAKAVEHFLKTWQPTINSIDTDSLVNAALYDTKYLGFRQNGQAVIRNVTLTGKNKLVIKIRKVSRGGQLTLFTGGYGGAAIATYEFQKSKLAKPFIEIPLAAVKGQHDLYLQYKNPRQKDPDRMDFQMDWFYFTKDFAGKNEEGYATFEKDYWALMQANPPTTLIMLDKSAERSRITRVFDRGNWLTPTKKVAPNTPKILNPFPENAPKNRLGLAQWLTDKKNPLTARTMVNRLWEQLFGQGLVQTLEDLGTQGEEPTHPELLDWLAHQYMNDFEWSTKRLLSTMVLSATYRQSVKVDHTALRKDPLNKWYSRGPRVRLSAEQVRDQALAISGLLNPKMYGPPVMPYQPAGVWSSPYNNDQWKLSEADEKYRRAIYTYMKRSAPYPILETFDMATRDICSARRIRTNTPLQALVTLNDEGYLEAAKYFAQRIRAESQGDYSMQIKLGYELALGKTMDEERLAVFVQLYQQSLADFQKDVEAARKMTEGLNLTDEVSEAAAMVVVTNALMNLDEFMMK